METDELQEYLNALGRSDNYRVDAVLSDAPHERTERVFYVGNNGSELGPFIRKTIATDSGQGRTYEKIFRAQHEGKRFVHMPRIFECYVADSSLVVLLEYVEGETLQDYVGERGASYELALRIFPPICDAASELHKAFDPPLIHRDLTPANIVVSPGGITIIDLSIARTFQPDATKDTTYFGTRAYAPPEQFGFGQTDVRSDVYTLGKVLAFCAGASSDEEGSVSDPCIARVVRKPRETIPKRRSAQSRFPGCACFCATSRTATEHRAKASCSKKADQAEGVFQPYSAGSGSCMGCDLASCVATFLCCFKRGDRKPNRRSSAASSVVPHR